MPTIQATQQTISTSAPAADARGLTSAPGAGGGFQRDIRTVASEYIDAGCAVVPLLPREKRCTRDGWQKGGFTAGDFAPGDNIGILTGESSNWLVDVDLDCPEAVAAAAQFLPPTGATFGRGGAATHRLYVAEGAETVKHKWPKGMRLADDDHDTTVELRAGGCQTMAPGSIHPSGELVEWIDRGTPATVDAIGLTTAVTALHDHVVAMKRMQISCHEIAETRRGSRNDTTNAIGYAVGRKVAGGAIAPDAAIDAVAEAAAASGLSDREARTVANSAVKAAVTNTVVLPGNGVTISECAAKLGAKVAAKKKLFMRGGKVARVKRDKSRGTTLELLTADEFRSIIEDYGELFAWRQGRGGEPVLKPTTCPVDTATALMAADAFRDAVPTVSTLTPVPVYANTASGGRLLGPGYHDALGGVLVSDSVAIVEMPIERARETLNIMFAEYSYVTPSDRSRAIALLLTPMLRMGGWYVGHTPVGEYECDTQQGGKTYQVHVKAAVYGSVAYPITKQSGGVGSLDEKIQQGLVEARSNILLDNLRGHLDSAFMEMVATAGGVVPCRVPHHGTIPVDTSSTTFDITSNGLSSTVDLTKRACIVRIKKRHGYAFRKFPEGDLLRHVQANRGLYLGALVAIIREWARLGCPRTTDTRHDFREWAQTCDAIVGQVLGEAPLLDGHVAVQERVGDTARTWWRDIALVVDKAARLNKELRASELANLALDFDVPIPNLKPDADDENRARRIGAMAARVFGEEASIAFDDFTIAKDERATAYADTGAKPAKVYTFTRTAAPVPPTGPPTPPPPDPSDTTADSGTRNNRNNTYKVMENRTVFLGVRGIVPLVPTGESSRKVGVVSFAGGRRGEYTQIEVAP
jgi:hypothetical protein